MRPYLSVIAAAGIASVALAGCAVEHKSVENILRDNKCSRGQADAKEKEGPTYRRIAEKYRGQPDAEQKLIAHMASWPVVEVAGHPEKHKKLNASDADLKNLAQWLLSH